MPRITAVMPVFNCADTVAEALHGVLEQTYRDFELVVVDDGSTDGTAKVVAAFEDARIHLVRTVHAGAAAAEHVGIDHARGEFLICLAGDDTYEPELFARQVELLDVDPATACVGVWTRTFGTRLRVDRPPIEPNRIRRALRRRRTLTQPTMYRLAPVREVGGLRNGGADDWDLWIRLAAKHDIRVVPELLAAIRTHPKPRTTVRRALAQRRRQVGMRWRALRALGPDFGSLVAFFGAALLVLSRGIVDAWRSRARVANLIDPPSIGVVVPTVGRPATLARCLDAVAVQRHPPDEIVVVRARDDHRTDGFLRGWVAKDPARHRVVIVDRPGQVHALRRGTDVIRTDVVAYLDDDARPQPGWIAELRRLFLDPRVGAAGGRVHEPSGGNPRKPARTIGRVTWYGRVIFGLDTVSAHYGPVDWLPGTNVAILRGAAKHDDALLPLPSGVEMYNDLDLCLQVRRAGYRVVYSPFAVVDHDAPTYPDPSFRSRVPVASLEMAAADRIYILAKHLRWYRRFALYVYMGVIGTSTVPAPGRVLVEMLLHPGRARAMARRLAGARNGRRAGRALYRSYRHDRGEVAA